MFGKAPRQTIFDAVATTPGPGAYNPKDTKSAAAQGIVNFSKQGERFRREDSNLSTCSTSTTGSASSFKRPTAPVSRMNRLQDRLRTFEQQIRERDQIISRLRMDRSAAFTRYQTLFDAYKHLRRVSTQAIPAHKLPKDISQEIQRVLQEEKIQTREESRPSMSEVEIKDSMSTFIVEIEQTDDPRITALESEKAALEASLTECQSRVKELDQERERLGKELRESAFEISHLKGTVHAAEVKDAELRAQLDRVNAMVDSLSSNSTSKDDRLFAALTELGQTKGQLAALETQSKQQTARFDEWRAKHDGETAKLKAQIEDKNNTLRELNENLNNMSVKVQETTAALRCSQEERDRLSNELKQTGNDLDKLVQENSVLEKRSNTTDAELDDLRNKCQKRKDEICELEEQLRTARTNYEQAESRARSAEQEVSRLRDELRTQVRSGDECRDSFERQLRQSQENFERQLDEATKKYELLMTRNAEIETELCLAVNNRQTLERQVQERDGLLERYQHEKESLQQQIEAEQTEAASLRQEMSAKENEIEALELRISGLQANEEELGVEMKKTEAICQDLGELAENRLNEIAQLQNEISAQKTVNADLEAALERVNLEVTAAHGREQSVQQEFSQLKLLHLATTAELDQTKEVLDKAREDTSEIEALREELESAEGVKDAMLRRVTELEGDNVTLMRVKDLLQEQLREAEEKSSRLQEQHDEELRQAKLQSRLVEQQLQMAKKAHEEELVQLKLSLESDRQRIDESTTARLRELQEKLEREKIDAVSAAQHENELLKADRRSLLSEKESLRAQLTDRDSELATLRQSKTEAEFFSHKCRELESEAARLRESVSILQEDVSANRQELSEVQRQLDEERRANEAHAAFTLAVINSQCNGGGERVEALQAENDRLRHHLQSVTQLLDTLEHGIESSEKQKSAYVSSLAETQEQIRRLVGHTNNKQRIQYVGKLQQENRELKEEQAKLRAKVDASNRRVGQLEQQLRRYREQENRLDHTAMQQTSSSHHHHTANVSTFPRMF